jgi:hypothetical protein
MTNRLTFAERLEQELRKGRGPDRPAALVKSYFDDNFSGADFERFGRNNPNEITSDDIIATTMLSISISSNKVRGFTPSEIVDLMGRSAETGALLRQIPTGRSLEELSERQFNQWLAPGGPADSLYHLILDIFPNRYVATNKLVARKRPALMPIHDSVVKRVLGPSSNFWESWWRALQETEIVERLRDIRNEANQPHLSLLRVADLVIWMRHH